MQGLSSCMSPTLQIFEVTAGLYTRSLPGNSCKPEKRKQKKCDVVVRTIVHVLRVTLLCGKTAVDYLPDRVESTGSRGLERQDHGNQSTQDGVMAETG